MGLTSLFGMGRGGPHRYSHLKLLRCALWQLISLTRNIESYSQLQHNIPLLEAYGKLVLLGFDVTTFTPAAYQRHRL